MSTLQVRLQDLTTRVATECKSIRQLLNGNAANLSALTFGAKTTLVAALNELKAELDDVAASVGATIDDAETSSTTKTWSIDKIASELADTAAAVKDEILNGAGAAYDTLAELQAFLEGSAADVTALLTAVGNRVRFDAAQTLTSPEKAQARSNIGAYGPTELGDPDTNLVTTFEAGLA